MPQLTRMTLNKGACRYFRCPYQAKVMKIFEMVSRTIVVMVCLCCLKLRGDFQLCNEPGVGLQAVGRGRPRGATSSARYSSQEGPCFLNSLDSRTSAFSFSGHGWRGLHHQRLE